MNILITGSRAPVAILLARTLRSLGHRIYTADSLRPNFGQHCQVVTEDFELPPPRYEPQQFMEALAALAKGRQLDLIIPTCEETFLLSAWHAALPEQTPIFAPPLEVLETLHHKGRAMVYAASLGLPTPRTCAAPDFRREGVMKRAYSRFSSHIFPLRGPEKVRRQLADKVPYDGSEWIWQEWIYGTPLSAYSLCLDGVIYAHAAYRTPYTAGLGSGIFYDAIDGPLYHKTLEMAQTLAASTRYTGSLAFDAIEEANGHVVLIEVNPRATMGLALLAHQPEFARIWQRILEHKDPPQRPLPGRERRQLKLAMLVYGSRQASRNFWRWQRWLHDWRTTPDVLADKNDPGPAKAALHIYRSYVRKARAKKISPLALTTDDIEWNGRWG